MTKIPGDILRKVFDIVECMESNKLDAFGVSDSRYATFITNDANAIARAILAERQRCARVAYVTCAKTRHVNLGREVEVAILKGEQP